MTTETTPTFLFHNIAKEQKMKLKERCDIGLIISKTYQQIFVEHPGKIAVKTKKGKTLYVNQYPQEFRQIVDNIIADYKKNPVPWNHPSRL